jgi:hypothetical protein
MRQRVRKLESLVAELDSPGIREDLKQAKARLKTLEAASSKPDSKRLDQAKAMLLRAGNRFMDRPEGERNADLLTVMDHCLIDTTYQPEGQDWERRIVQQIVLR